MGPLWLGLPLLAQIAPAEVPPAPPGPPAEGRATFATDSPAPSADSDDDVVTWFARLDLGLGTRGFSENSALLSELGYGDMKLWATMDGAWMFHERVGAGLFMGVNRQFSREDDRTPVNLKIVSYFVGVQLPVLLAGNRYWAFHATPRGGYATGVVTGEQGKTSDFQHTGTFGAAVSFHSFFAHVGASVAFMHTPAGPPGQIGRNMDYGGLYFTLAGSIDG